MGVRGLSKRFKWGINLTFIFILILSLFGCNSDTDVAKIGNEGISEQEFVQELKRVYGKEILDEMVNKKVVQLTAKKYGIKASQEQITNEFNELKKDYDTEEDFNTYLKEQMGWSKEQLLDYIEYYILWEEIATKDIDVADEHIQAYYGDHVDEYRTPAKMHIQQILVKTKEEADQVLQEISAGSDFNTLAKERSIDVLTANSGGDLGLVAIDDGSISSNILTKAEELKPGELAIVQVDNNYAVIRVLKHIDAKYIPLENVKDKIRREIALQQVSLTDVMEQLKTDLQVKVLDETLQ